MTNGTPAMALLVNGTGPRRAAANRGHANPMFLAAVSLAAGLAVFASNELTEALAALGFAAGCAAMAPFISAAAEWWRTR